MIKQLLKKVLPLKVIRQSALKWNKFRIKTVDPLLFPKYELDDSRFLIKRDDYPFKLIPVDTTGYDPRLAQQVVDYENWTQDEYMLVFDEYCVIEPREGWAIAKGNKLIYPSLGFSDVPYLRKPKLGARWAKPKKVYDELISLRDTGDENYFHLYNDILPKLFFLDEKLGIDHNIPILISRRMFDKPFVKPFLELPYFKNRKWIIQEPDEYIGSRKTYFCKPLTHTKKYYDQLLDEMNLPAPSADNRKIFISRRPARLRHIENMDEVKEICVSYGFEIVEFEDLTLAQQADTMASARFVIGIHGAGLTNMLFRRNRPMTLLEIYSPGAYYAFHYVLMAVQYGFRYLAVIGDDGGLFTGGFTVPVAALKADIEKMMEEEKVTARS